MVTMSSYAWLLLLTICYWHCMALKENNKRSAPAHSHSEEAAYSEEAEYSEEASSHSQEASSHSQEASSNSQESSHSKETSHSQEVSNSKETSSEHKGPTCTDHKKNEGETDIDCGGKKCGKCVDGKKCKVNPDCVSGSCKNKICVHQSTTTTTTTTTPEPTTTTPEPTTTTPKPPTTTTPEPTTTTPKPPTTTTPEPTTTTTTPEPTTTTPEPTTTTPVPTTTTTPVSTTTTTPVSTTTTPVPTTTTTPVPTTTTPVPKTTTTAEPTTTISICEPECQNGGTCTDNNVCTCTTDFSGPTCEVQSVGLCLNSETFDTEPILLITFGNGSIQYSTATPNNFDFNTTYQQRFAPTTNDGMFSFVNLVNENSAWHTDAMDHTKDDGGYMYLVNADFTPGQFYNGRVDNLCIGLRYEFSVYLANLCKPSGRINPNVLFEVRSTEGNILLAQLESGDIVEQDTLTWEKYGFSFIAPSSSVNLLMISNALGGNGNDIVIDDIVLRVCVHTGSGFCPSE